MFRCHLDSLLYAFLIWKSINPDVIGPLPSLGGESSMTFQNMMRGDTSIQQSPLSKQLGGIVWFCSETSPVCPQEPQSLRVGNGLLSVCVLWHELCVKDSGSFWDLAEAFYGNKLFGMQLGSKWADLLGNQWELAPEIRAFPLPLELQRRGFRNQLREMNELKRQFRYKWTYTYKTVRDS